MGTSNIVLDLYFSRHGYFEFRAVLILDLQFKGWQYFFLLFRYVGSCASQYGSEL